MKIFTIFQTNYINQKFSLLVLVCFLVLSNFSYSQATFVSNPTNAAMLGVLDGDGISLSNATLETGDRATQLAIFSNGTAGANLALDGGVMLSTGSATQAFGNNSQTEASINAPGIDPYNDPDITAIDATANNDVVVFSFDVVLEPGFTDLKVVYQFGSDEYPDYVGSVYNDIFGFFISGPGIVGSQNIALVPGTTSPVAVNTINAGFLGCNDDIATEDLTNFPLYINNGHDTSAAACNTNPGPFIIFTEYNGLTQQLTGLLSGLVAGNTYRFKMAIADAGDPSLDSGVFISTISGDKDSDGDGLSDAKDPDDDDDGILDVDEGGAAGAPNLDADGDGVPAYLDDNDNDFSVGDVDGLVQPQFDLDGDGISNHLDLDSDNDGILDVIEAGGTDPDNDGVIGTGTPIDIDKDGLADVVDNVDSGSGAGEVTTGTPLLVPNSDSTGGADYLDIDADDDGIVDNIEAQNTIGYLPPLLNDGDGDGIDDRYDIDAGGTPLTPINTDAGSPNSDAIPDYLDLDSDGDGEDDVVEAYDINNDGVADTTPSFLDSDNDGLDNNFDVNDASLDPTNGGQTATNPFPDTDSPGGEANWREWINISVLKTDTYVDTNTNGIIDAGDTINYTFRITNNGASAITNINLTDADPNVVITGGPIVVLTSGSIDTNTFTATYTILAADITTGNYSNTATVSGLDSNANAVTSLSDDPDDPANATDDDNDGNPDDPTVTDLRQPFLDITKTSTGVADTNGNGIIDVGDTINYTFVVTNTGNVDLTGISVTDVNATIVPATTIDLVAGAVDNSTYTASYVITAGDITTGNFTNTAVASAPNPLGGAAVTDDSDDPNDATNVDPNNDGSPDDPTVTDLRQPLLDITKTSTGVVDTNGSGILDAGDTINYTFVVTNRGNIDLTGISVTDANATVVPATTIDLIVGAVDNSTYTASYVITAGDIAAGNFTNTAVASAPNPLGGAAVTDDSDDPNNITNIDPNNDGSPDDPTVTNLIIIDTDNDGIEDAVDLDDDNDGILDIQETCVGFLSQNTTGAWLGKTTSTISVNFPGVSYQSNIGLFNDRQINYNINQNGGEQRMAKTGDVNLELTFSPAVPVEEIAFWVNDVDPTTFSLPPSAKYTITVNGGSANGLFSKVLGDLNYNTNGIISLNGIADNQSIVIKGNGGTLVSTLNITSTDLGSDFIAYSFFAKENCDTDGDGIGDYLDLDSDNDGITDLMESGQLNNGAIDANQDGIIDGVSADFGANGLANSVESNDTNTATTANPTSTDTDGRANYIDIDSDNDGIVDNIEGQSTTGYFPPSGNDTDADGIDDQYDVNCTIATCGLVGTPIVPENTDGLADGTDYLDLDSDEDGESDTIEAYDSNDDGVVDATDTIGTTPDLGALGTDSDGDGLDDEFDTDGTGTINTSGSTNGGQTAVNPFPDTDNPGGDPDWRAIDDEVDLVVAKVVSDTTPAEGDSIIYTITVTNNGAPAATSVVLTDLLPSGVTYVSDTGGGAYVSGTGIWTIGTINNTGVATIDIVASVDTGTSGDTITNTVTGVTLDQTDTNTTPDDPSEDIVVSNAIDLVVAKTVSNATPDEGDSITYTITVTNNGPAQATNVVLTDLLPSGVTFVSATPAADYNAAVGVWTIGTITSAGVATLDIVASVDAGTSGDTITNTVTGVTLDQTDNNTTPDDPSEDIVVNNAVDLVVAKTV
ncbi:DUF7507 domain-containing protein, partial [Aquimarina muelleri]